MAGVFINYRRDDSGGYAGRICAWLKRRLGDDRVFMDIEGLAPGEDYLTALHNRIASAQLILVLIGPHWVHATDHRELRRLEQADDVVRMEIVTAISRGIQLVPVLVGGAAMPSKDELPEAIGGLARLNALEVSEKFFDRSMEYLARYFDGWGISSAVAVAGPDRKEGTSFGKMKVCLVGAFGVGKTSLVRRFVDSIFGDSYITTLRVKVDSKNVNVRGRAVTLVIWDMAGEEEGVPINLINVRGASGVFLVADGCRASTLKTAMEIRRRIHDEIGPVPTVLAVNKVDLSEEWEVRMEDLESYSRIGTTVFTTSAKTGKGVEQMFLHLARQIDEIGPGEAEKRVDD